MIKESMREYKNLDLKIGIGMKKGDIPINFKDTLPSKNSIMKRG
jgi:hypothetical protein